MSARLTLLRSLKRVSDGNGEMKFYCVTRRYEFPNQVTLCLFRIAYSAAWWTARIESGTRCPRTLRTPMWPSIAYKRNLVPLNASTVTSVSNCRFWWIAWTAIWRTWRHLNRPLEDGHWARELLARLGLFELLRKLLFLALLKIACLSPLGRQPLMSLWQRQS